MAQILNGKHHNRALDAHQISLQVLFDLWVEAFFEENPTVHQKFLSSMETVWEAYSNGLDVTEAHCQLVSLISTLELEKRLEEFDQKNDKYPMYRWARSYMKQVSNLLQFMRGTRDCNWFLHLTSIEKMCVYFSLHSCPEYSRSHSTYVRTRDQPSTHME